MRTIARWFAPALLLAFAASAIAGQAGQSPSGDPSPIPRLGPAQSQFALRCAGCHGLQGESVPQLVPTLRGTVGHFLCTSEGRDYLVRLPNVALSSLDDQELAEVLNFVIFSVGAGSVPPDARPYTAAEVRGLRAKVLNRGSLYSYRAKVVEALISRCGAPASLRRYRPDGIQGHLGERPRPEVRR